MPGQPRSRAGRFGVERDWKENQKGRMTHRGEQMASRNGPRGRALAAVALLALGAGTAARGADEGSSLLSGLFGSGKQAPAYVGNAACVACHAAEAHAFSATAHARTTSLPSEETIHGKFTAGENILRTINPNLVFVMEAHDRAFFLTAHMKTSATEELNRSERIAVVVGSGRKGQSYLYWDGDQLFQLPVSYWTELDRWVNSPGFTDGSADFDRAIVPRCLECHSSSFVNRPPPENRYDSDSLVLGISCEKCHGPGSEHVARFRSATPPTAPSEFAVVDPARLSRARQLDICALCHNGAAEALAPALSFVPGDDLSLYLAFKRPAAQAPVDVHARQVPLLESSRCFRFSTTMTCSTCHDVHAPQRDAASFSARCLTCHKVESCRLFPKRGHAIDTGCIDCHMPLQETGKIVSEVDGSVIRPMVRNHRIAIYPENSLH